MLQVLFIEMLLRKWPNLKPPQHLSYIAKILYICFSLCLEMLRRLNIILNILFLLLLLQDWAEPYHLWECKLAILQCAGHPDPMLVNNIWAKIVDQQVWSKQIRI